MIVKINGKVVKHNGYFAYDGCHKIYILEDNEDVENAKNYGYTIYPIVELKEAYKNSCPLRFIDSWKDFTTYVAQFKRARIGFYPEI